MFSKVVSSHDRLILFFLAVSAIGIQFGLSARTVRFSLG